jgi:type II secretory pathway component PulF
LLGLSNFLQNWGLVILGVALALLTLIVLRIATPEGQMWRDRIKLKLPIMGQIFQSFAVARFCRVLGTLLHNGVPILRSLEISSGAAGNRVLASAIREAAENISAGETLATPLAASGHFPRNVVEMIAVAEEANNLENVLTEIAESTERRTWRQLDLAVRLLEPLMLLLLAVAVLFVAVALLMPVFKMSTTL